MLGRFPRFYDISCHSAYPGLSIRGVMPQVILFLNRVYTMARPGPCQSRASVSGGATGTYPKKRFIETQHATGPTAVVTLARDLGKNIVLDASFPGCGLQGVSLLGFELEDYLP